MRRIALIAALACAAPAFADSQRVAPKPNATLELGLKAQDPRPRAKDLDDYFDDFDYRGCQEDGGGASTGEDGEVHCTDPDGKELW